MTPNTLKALKGDYPVLDRRGKRFCRWLRQGSAALICVISLAISVHMDSSRPDSDPEVFFRFWMGMFGRERISLSESLSHQAQIERGGLARVSKFRGQEETAINSLNLSGTSDDVSPQLPACSVFCPDRNYGVVLFSDEMTKAIDRDHEAGATFIWLLCGGLMGLVGLALLKFR